MPIPCRIIMLNQNALRWLATNPLVHADLARAWKMSQSGGGGGSVSRVGRIDDDMQLGYWMSQAPGARYVRFRRGVWHDRFSDQMALPKLLMAHRTPWLVYNTLSAQVNSLWIKATHARVRALCDHTEPICNDCAHEPSQRGCIAEIELEDEVTHASHESQAAMNSTLCPGPYPNRRPGRCPAFVRGTHPDASAQCWRALARP